MQFFCSRISIFLVRSDVKCLHSFTFHILCGRNHVATYFCNCTFCFISGQHWTVHLMYLVVLIFFFYPLLLIMFLSFFSHFQFLVIIWYTGDPGKLAVLQSFTSSINCSHVSWTQVCNIWYLGTFRRLQPIPS